jgi:cytochrome o ubiquinol oxidase subunit III
MAQAEIIKAGPGTVLWNAAADEHDPISARTFGFWLYMLSDGLIFASLFASYAVLDNPMNAAGHPMAAQLLSAGQGMVQTILVLASVLALSLGTLAIKTGNKAGVSLGLIAAAALGVTFLYIGAADLTRIAAAGNVPGVSAYLSCLFTLIITHGLHMGFGLLWMAVLLVQIKRSGFTTAVVGRLLCLRMFWQFQASVWVIVYVYVYLFGGAH